MHMEVTIFRKKRKKKMMTMSPGSRYQGTTMKSFRLTKRDISIVQTVLACRALTSQQIERLHFPPDKGQPHRTKTSRCLLRLRFLYRQGYLTRVEQPQKLSEGRRPYIYL